MMPEFMPACRPALIGSLPLEDHLEAAELVFRYTPEIPSWAQLSKNRQETMIPQFLAGLPGLREFESKESCDLSAADYESELLRFYEEYMAVVEGGRDLEDSRFVLTETKAPGFFVFLEQLERRKPPLFALKGQVTGPFTFTTGLQDQNQKAIFYDPQLRDAAVKLLALRARWQVRRLARFQAPVLVFFDEPALAGFGSSEFISVSREEVQQCLEEAIAAVHDEGGLAGVHVCANTDWSLVLDTLPDIVSFDAYSYFDRFVLYTDSLKHFVEGGGVLAWGIVPTSNPEDIDGETTESLAARWRRQFDALIELGFERRRLEAQTMITPSCGTGSLSVERAGKVLRLTRELADTVRSQPR
jgi:methionine synthase II (cobalamin-independent)